MKVLVAPAHIVFNSSYGSEVSWAYNIISRLAKSFNVQIDAICGKSDRTTFPFNMRVFEVGFDKGDLINRGLFYLRCFTMAKKLYKNADLVHHMFPFGYRAGFNPLATFGYLRNKPYVIGPIQYPQEYSDVSDYMWVSGKMGAKAEMMYGLESFTAKSLSGLIRVLHETTLEEAEALVFDSKRTFGLYNNLYSDMLKNKIIKIIPPGVETEIFKFSTPTSKDYFEIMTVSYLLKRKGIQYLIYAMPDILRQVGNVKLRIVGDGPYRAELVAIVRKLSLQKYVIFEGMVSREELVRYYHLSDIFVLPALSTTSSVFLESQACGRPVIGTTAGFIPELIVNGRTGFVVRKCNLEELKEKVIKLLIDRDLRLKMGVNARNWVEENFSWDRLVRKYYELFTSVL